MRKKQLDSLHHVKHSARRGLCTALCATAAAGGILVSRRLSHKAERTRGKRMPQETASEKIHESLVRAISHDLRTPLSGIMGNSLLYLENHETLNQEERLQLVSHIHEDSGWLINIVENLLAMTRISDMDSAVRTREEIVEEVLGEALQKMKMRHPGFEVHAVIPDQIGMLPLDALLIEQVLINLLENALRHSGSREPVDVIVEDGESQVTFIVRDYGCGIRDEALSHLSRNTPDTTLSGIHRKYCIGLVICKAIISAHHGSFTGRNHSHGAEFVFTLPKGAFDVQ